MIIFPQVRRPLVGVALSVGFGFYLEQSIGFSPLFLLSVSAFILAAISWNPYRCSVGGIYLACIVLAASYGAIERVRSPSQAVLSVAEIDQKEQEIVGVVSGDPVYSEDGSVSVQFLTQAVLFGDEWQSADCRLRLYIQNFNRPILYGERWRFRGRYRSREHVYGGETGYISVDGSDMFLLRPAPFSLKGFCYKIRRRAVPVFCEGMEDFPVYPKVIQALLLGYRKVLPPELYRTFSLTGTLHIFAISGLHVGVMASICIAVLKALGISKIRWGFFLIPLLFFYVISTGMKSSAFRAFTMAAIYFGAPVVRRRADPVSAIALSAIILLLINPLQLDDLGFILSFTVVSGIVMVHAYTVRRCNGFSRPAWMVPLAQVGGPKPLKVIVRSIGMLALTSVAAWLFSAPLTARFFNTFSPIALFGNLIIIPLTFMIVLTGCWTLLVAACSLPWVGVFNHANQVFTGLLTMVIDRLGALPGAYFFVRGPSLTQVILWYAGLILFFTGPRRLQKTGLVVTLFACVLWVGSLPRPFDGITEWRERDTSVAVQVEKGQWVLVVEGAPYSISRTVRRLMKEGVTRLQTLVIDGTQADVRVIQELYDLFPADQICLHPRLQGSSLASELERVGVDVQFSDQPQWAVGKGIIGVNLSRY